MKENIEVTRLSNGLTILTEKMPDVRSATLGFFYRSGSRHEPANLSGISHFIEHTVFKGTEKRNALQIAIETDRLGGHFDAFTMHEQTGFTIKTVDSALPNAFDLMADLLTNPRFDEVELNREQKVIIEDPNDDNNGIDFNEEKFDRNAEYMAEAVRLVPELASEYSYYSTLSSGAKVLFDRGKYEKALPLISRLIVTLSDPVRLKESLVLRANIYEQIGKQDLAAADRQRAGQLK